MDKYLLERDGQLDFYEVFLPRIGLTPPPILTILYKIIMMVLSTVICLNLSFMWLT